MENMTLNDGSFLSLEDQKLVENVYNASEENGKAIELFGHDMYSLGYLAGAAKESERLYEMQKRETKKAFVAAFAEGALISVFSALGTYLVMKNKWKIEKDKFDEKHDKK